MNSFPNRTSNPLPRGAASDLWRHTLTQIPTLFGQLVYLASLRDSNTGKYQHHGLAAVFGQEEAEQAMRDSHVEVFARWLEMTLPEQKADIEAYVQGLDVERRRVVEVWSAITPYLTLPPAGALQVERDLFLADLEAMLSLLRNELGVSFADPTA